MCAIIKNPLQRDGTSQEERLLKALLPQNALLDDRKIEDILSFAASYSKLINFYNVENKPDGDWSCFYENDPCIQLALLATIDTDSIETGFKQVEEKINNWLTKKDCSPGEEDETVLLPGYYDEMINIIYNIALRIQLACKKLPDGHLLKEEIITIIKNNLKLAIIDNKQQDALIKLIGFDKASLAPQNDYTPFIQTLENSLCNCTKSWQLDLEGYDCIYPDNSFNHVNLKVLFNIFIIELIKIKQRAKIYFEECIEKNDAHEPHVTLFLTFLYLFQYAIDHLNTLTRSHLLYYYEKVLCLHKLKEVPDQVHVVFELAKNFYTHLIEEGTLLNGGKDDAGKQMVYALMEEVVANKAKVEEIKTVYISEYSGVVHAAIKAETKDGIEEAFNKEEQPQWKPLGNMASPLTEVGFAFASPMFLLEEGLRAGMINFKLNQAAAKIDRTTFRLMYSSEKNWVEIEQYENAAERLIKKYEKLLPGLPGWYKALQQVAELGLDLIKQVHAALYDSKTIDKITLSTLNDFVEKSEAGKKIKEIVETVEKDIEAAELIDKNTESYLTSLLADIMALQNVFICRQDKKNKLDFLFVANYTSPAFTAPLPGEQNPALSSEWPVIKVLVKNTNAPESAYLKLKHMKVSSASIKVGAYGIKNIVVQNDTSILDNSKEIQPFTARPYRGSYFYLGSKEIFQKKLDLLGVQLEWADMPDLGTHYANYITQNVNSNRFTADAELLSNGNFMNVYPGNNLKLFSGNTSTKTTLVLGLDKPLQKNDNGGEVPVLKSAKKNAPKAAAAEPDVRQNGVQLNTFQRNPFMPAFSEYSVKSQSGFMRLNLKNDFLHSEYAPAYTAVVAKEKDKLDPTHLPKEPYTPKLKNTTLFYIATEEVSFGTASYNATIEQFYHITPFGYEKIAIDKLNEVFLLPQFNHAAFTLFTQGNLYIGLKDAEPEQKVNILFQVLDGTGDNRFAPPDIEWSYLVDNQWIAFKPFEIQDHTRADESSRKSLLKSGIIEFSLPKAISSKLTTILNAGLLWIRASAHEDLITTTDSDSMLGLQSIAALPDLVAIIAQAGIAEFKNNNNSLSHLATPLPAKTIAKFIDSRAAVKKVEQPYYSFNGRLPENDNQFYARVSERLRHKNRAVCIWDYEHLVLQAFPQVHKAKCLNHTGIAQNLLQPGIFKLREITPGFVTVSVIPDLRNKNAINKLEPRVPIGLLDEIKVFLKKRTNHFLTLAYTDKLDFLQVLNPLYEQLKIKTCVRFYKGLDAAYYKYVLNDDLKQFLSPWAFDANKEINFGSTFHKSAILNFIEERKYVDVVLGFEVIHYKDGLAQPEYDEDWIIPTTSRSILTSYNSIDAGDEYEHKIEFVPYDENNPCPDCSVTTHRTFKKQPVN